MAATTTNHPPLGIIPPRGYIFPIAATTTASKTKEKAKATNTKTNTKMNNTTTLSSGYRPRFQSWKASNDNVSDPHIGSSLSSLPSSPSSSSSYSIPLSLVVERTLDTAEDVLVILRRLHYEWGWRPDMIRQSRVVQNRTSYSSASSQFEVRTDGRR